MDVETIIQGGGLILSGAAVGKIVDVAVKAWTARHHKGEVSVTPDPLNVRKEDKFVTRGEFNKHVEQNDAAHTEIFRRLKETEQKTEHQDGKLDVIGSDVKTIKDILIGKALKK